MSLASSFAPCPSHFVSASKKISANRSQREQHYLRLKNATVHLTLERPLNSRPVDLQKVPENSPSNRQVREKAFASRHQTANSFVLTAADAESTGDRFTASLTRPSNAPWSNLVVRASAALSNDASMGITLVPVK